MTTTTTSGPTSFKRTGSAPSKPTDPPADRPAASSGWRLGIASGFVGFVGAQGGRARTYAAPSSRHAAGAMMIASLANLWHREREKCRIGR